MYIYIYPINPINVCIYILPTSPLLGLPIYPGPSMEMHATPWSGKYQCRLNFLPEP